MWFRKTKGKLNDDDILMINISQAKLSIANATLQD